MPARTLRAWNVLQETVSRWSSNDGSTLAASIAYYAAFSFFPLLLVLTAGFGLALRLSPVAQDAQKEILDMLSKNVAPQFAEQVAYLLTQVQLRAGTGGPLGLVALLFGAIGIFTQLDTALDRLWHDTTPRATGWWATIVGVLGNRFRAFLLLMGLGFLVLVAFCVSLALSGVETWASDWPIAGRGMRWLRIGGVLLVNGLAFTLLYKTMPKAPVRWQHALFGGVVVAAVWELGRQVLTWVVVGSNYSAYGVIGAFIAMMVWVYYASTLMLLGAQLVQVLGHPPEASPPASG